MRINTYIISLAATVILVLATGNVSYSQGTDLSRTGSPKFYIGLSLLPAQSNIRYEGTSKIISPVSEGEFTFSGSVDAGYNFSENFGISTGIGFKSYRNKLTLSQYQSSFPDIDPDEESYERRVTGTDIREELELGFLSLPLRITLRLPVNDKLGFFIQPGIDFAIPVSNGYKNSGKFTYKGYYAAYNVLLEDLPDYGFPTNLSSSSEGNVETSSLGYNALIAGGFDFYINRKIQIAVAALYNKSLANVSGYSTTEQFQLSPGGNSMNSLMGAYNKASTSSFGLSLSLRYYLK